MDLPESPLQIARRHAALGERLVAEQEQLIGWLRACGHPTGEAEELLTALQRSLALMLEHLAQEEKGPSIRPTRRGT
jgi:hypothetical protein